MGLPAAWAFHELGNEVIPEHGRAFDLFDHLFLLGFEVSRRQGECFRCSSFLKNEVCRTDTTHQALVKQPHESLTPARRSKFRRAPSN